jgi:hypothetical protein
MISCEGYENKRSWLISLHFIEETEAFHETNESRESVTRPRFEPAEAYSITTKTYLFE